MESNITKINLTNFTYEIIERIIRFILHLEEIEKQFYFEKNKYTDKIELIDVFKKSLYDFLKIVTITYKNEFNLNLKSDYSECFNLFKDILSAINELHTIYLPILPRPSEPVELTRFERVIDRQIVQLTDKKNKRDISISINEIIGEEINADPLYAFKESTLKKLEKYKIFEKFVKDDRNKEDYQDLNKEKLHITIPRIDASNTFRWASLIHEMSHPLFRLVKFEKEDIEKEFLGFINGSKDLVFNGFFSPNKDTLFPITDTLKNWLEECWCDLFACILIGPSFYFSQYLVFFNEKSNKKREDYVTHPPSILRLQLIESILSHRFPSKLYKKLELNYISESEELISLLQENNEIFYLKTPELSTIFNAFNKYFIFHFLSHKKVVGSISNIELRNNEELNEKLKSLVNNYVNIQPEIIDYLKERLKIGLPIPSLKTYNDESKYEEIPTYIQEIFLASWLTRCDTIKPRVLDLINQFGENIISNNINDVYNDIKKIILRHDQAVLKSIQVSEWFDFLIQEKQRPNLINIFNSEKITEEYKLKLNGVLVDHEIEELILKDEIQIIPVMYFNQNPTNLKQKQIGTTSIDIRLGTSFQVFFPDQYGIIDFTEENTYNYFNISSKRINLDFIEGITITPGQFLLGHSMEYIKLPDYICGNLEGRSSFARLGIEIHMTAGYIDPGFEGVITFEIYNAGPTTVKLFPGMRIGQIRLEKNSVPKEKYSDKNTVKYKGLLEHDLSRQSNDIEVKLIRDFNNKKRR